jgi:hypothetical protein
LRDKVIDYFVQNGLKKQELAAELQERFEDIGDRMSPAELDKLKTLLATNDGIVSPQIIEVLYKSIKEKKITPGLYERISLSRSYSSKLQWRCKTVPAYVNLVLSPARWLVKSS